MELIAHHACQTLLTRAKEYLLALEKHLRLPTSIGHSGFPRAVWSRNSGLTCKVSFSVERTVVSTLHDTLRQRTFKQPRCTIQLPLTSMERRHEVCFSAERVIHSFKRIYKLIRIRYRRRYHLCMRLKSTLHCIGEVADWRTTGFPTIGQGIF
jgi:hypothetical protein